MCKHKTFTNPPIVEALMDIRVQLPDEVDLKRLEYFHDTIKERFPEKYDRLFFEASFKMGPHGSTIAPPVSTKTMGFLFRSSSEKKVVQARLDGFTFSKLAPYESWDAFQKEGQELWERYFMLFKPVKISRVALRYINRIKIPLPFKDFKEYILTVPEIAPNLSQELNHFFMQIQLPHEKEKNIKAVISQTLGPVISANTLPYIFDIDVWQEVNMGKNEETVWSIMDLLRDFKNDIFFKSTTEKCQELFK